MPNEWEINLTGYNINKFRYRELKAKCYQYRDWQQIINSSTADKSVTAVCKTKTDKVEQALAIAISTTLNNQSAELHKRILKVITGQETFTKLQTYYEIKISSKKYYALRRIFYYELDKLFD